ncbi:MAG: DUF4037 domain-containing protein [Actinomycetota bacterium]|nr:DUF4037 domain-containing protein [Actinomycetota bacterium]
MSAFVPGLVLARAFYEEGVAPLLGEVEHSAALLGTGSDVLGFDTERSTDHGWGPRLQVFVGGSDVAGVRRAVERQLPDEFRGWPTRYGWDAVPVTHHIGVYELAGWLRDKLGFDPRARASPKDWLTVPQQFLLEVTAGGVFHDGLGELVPAREALAWYPDDVWLWLIACQWRRIDQEEPFVGRTAEVGDELGSRIVAAHLVRDVVRMCFLQERRYAPYSKWLGSAFRRLDAFGALGDPLLEVLAAVDYETREAALIEAVTKLAARHNALGITAQVDESVGLFHDRPFRVLGSGRFVDVCLERVSDPWLHSLPLTGAIDQFVDSTDVLSKPDVFPRIGQVLEDADGWASEVDSRGHRPSL